MHKKTYEFTFIVDDNANSDIYELSNSIYDAGCDDATVSKLRGLVAVSFDREDSSYIQAIASAFEQLNSIHNLEISRFEPDYLVSQSEIAERANLTRQCISKYTNLDRSKAFPKPYARITSNSPLWDWVSVSYWLYQNGDGQNITVDSVKQAVIERSINYVVHLLPEIKCGAQLAEKIDYISALPIEESVSEYSLAVR